MPTVSVLIPAYRTKWLDVAIASVLAQTFQDYELIISDDSAGDDLENVVAKWGDPRIRYYKNPNRQAYLGSNRDNVISKAAGKYLRFLYDDDYLFPRSLEFLVNAAEATQAKLLFHGRHIVDENGKILQSPLSNQAGQVEVLEAPFYFENLIGKQSNFIGEPSNIMFEAEAFHRMALPFGCGGLRLRYLADVGLCTNYIAAGHLVLGMGFFGSAFRHHAGQNSSFSQPFHAAGYFEWELFRRWAVDAGHLSQSSYAAGVFQQMEWYHKLLPFFPEVAGFIELAGQPGLDGFMSAEYRRALAEAYDTIERRMATRAS